MTSNVQCLSDLPTIGTSPSGSLIAHVSPGAAVPPRPTKGTRWGGRAKGTPNKVNQSIREAIQMAFERAGGVAYLVLFAQEDPKTFVPMLIKTLAPGPRVPQENGLNIGAYRQLSPTTGQLKTDRHLLFSPPAQSKRAVILFSVGPTSSKPDPVTGLFRTDAVARLGFGLRLRHPDWSDRRRCEW